MDFKWNEVLLLAGNLLSAVYFFRACGGHSPVHYVAYFISCCGFVRLSNRLVEFKKYMFVVMRALWFMSSNMLCFLAYLLFFALYGYSVFRSEIRYCKSSSHDSVLIAVDLFLPSGASRKEKGAHRVI